MWCLWILLLSGLHILWPEKMSRALEMLRIPQETAIPASLSQLHSLKNSGHHPMIMYAFALKMGVWQCRRNFTVWTEPNSLQSPPSFVGNMSVHREMCHFLLGQSLCVLCLVLIMVPGFIHSLNPSLVESISVFSKTFLLFIASLGSVSPCQFP